MYKSQPEGRYLYVLNDALTEFTADVGTATDAPVPPSIAPCAAPRDVGGDPETCVQVRLSIEDRAGSASLLKITADSVRVQMTGSVAQGGEIETEVLEYFRAVLGVRLSQLALVRGQSPRDRLLRVWGTDHHTVRGVAVCQPEVLYASRVVQQVYAKLQANMPVSVPLEQP